MYGLVTNGTAVDRLVTSRTAEDGLVTNGTAVDRLLTNWTAMDGLVTSGTVVDLLVTPTFYMTLYSRKRGLEGKL